MKEKDNPQNGWEKKKVFANGDTRNSSPKHTVNAAQLKKKKIENWAKDQNGHFSREGIQRRHPGGHKVRENMLSIPTH